MIKIGLLLPRSTYYSSIGFDLYEGFRSGLESLKRDDITIVSDNIGFGTDQQHCYRIAEKMLMQDEVSVVFAYISHRTAQLLRPLFLAANKLLVVLDSGANLPQEWPSSPNIYHLSLQNSLGTMLNSMLASEDGYSQTAVATGYYDGGYLHTFAASFGCETFGSEITFNVATGYKRDEFSMAQLPSFFENNSKGYLQTIFSGDFVQWYFEEIKHYFPNQDIPMYLSPFALEETMLKDAIFPGNKAFGVASWSEQLSSNENNQFKEAMIEKGKTPNLFSLIGWEASIIANHLADLVPSLKGNGRAMGEALSDFRFVGPRGETFFHKETQTSLSPMYKTQIVPNDHGMCQLSEISIIEPELLLQSFESLSTQELDNSISGWFNSYTCI